MFDFDRLTAFVSNTVMTVLSDMIMCVTGTHFIRTYYVTAKHVGNLILIRERATVRCMAYRKYITSAVNAE